MLEKEIEGKVVAWAKKHGFLAPKVRFVEDGYPDRLFISPTGHTIFIEFKRPGCQPEPLQFYRLKQLQLRHIPAFWTDNYVGALSILKAALEPETVSGTGDPTSPVASIGGAVSGSRTREDVDGPRYPQDFEDEGAIHTSTGGGSPATNENNVAGGDREVE